MTLPAAPLGALSSEVEAQMAAALQRVPAAEEARRHHDVMNALTGIEGAATILIADNVSGEDRATMVRELQVDRDRAAVAATAPVAEALRQLLALVRELALAGPLIPLGRRKGDWVALWLKAEDGLQMPTQLPVAVHVAARLVESQGGGVRVEVGASGSPRIGIWLPAALDEGGGVDGLGA